MMAPNQNDPPAHERAASGGRVMTIDELARTAYEAWAGKRSEVLGWYKPFSWVELQYDQEYWRAAARAILAKLQEPEESPK